MNDTENTNVETESVETPDNTESLVDTLLDSIETPDEFDAETPADESDTDESEGVEAPDESDSDETVEADAPTDPKRIFIMVTMPQALFDMIDTDAKAASVGRAAMARELLAKAYNYELPEAVARTHKKYATEEEKVAARKAAAKSRNDQIKMLREQHKAKQELRALKAANSTDKAKMDALQARIDKIDAELLED